MVGDGGNDTYHFNLTYGLDSILESSGSDTVLFGDVDHDRLWFWRAGDDLRIGIINTNDWLTIDDWYATDGNKVEQFNTVDDGFALLQSQIQQLVAAMAVFDVQAAGNLYVPQADLDVVQPVIAAAWRAT